jgi:hypothetical protein
MVMLQAVMLINAELSVVTLIVATQNVVVLSLVATLFLPPKPRPKLIV